jgi:hypothetical protein
MQVGLRACIIYASGQAFVPLIQVQFDSISITSAPATTLTFLRAFEPSQPEKRVMDIGSIETKAERILDCLHIHRNQRIPKGAISVASNKQSSHALVEGPKQDTTDDIATLDIPYEPHASTLASEFGEQYSEVLAYCSEYRSGSLIHSPPSLDTTPETLAKLLLKLLREYLPIAKLMNSAGFLQHHPPL